jgi:hypothetical protein
MFSRSHYDENDRQYTVIRSFEEKLKLIELTVESLEVYNKFVKEQMTILS